MKISYRFNYRYATLPSGKVLFADRSDRVSRNCERVSRPRAKR